MRRVLVNKKIAYFINIYPKVSHSFIRREILALERYGFDIYRVALRGWKDYVADPQDVIEKDRTNYILKAGFVRLLLATLRVALTSPLKFYIALKLAISMSRRADRSLIFHLIYLAEASQMLQWLEKAGVEHVHAHFGTNSAEVVMLCHLMGGPPYSFTVHGPEEFDKTTFIYLKEKVAHSAFVIAISSYTRSQLYRWADYTDWGKIHVVHCAIESGFHNFPPLPIPTEPRLVCVGRICEQKGQLLLIEAAHRLALDHIDFELILAGDGEMRSEVESLIEKYQLQDKVKITGWVSSDEVRELILSSRALVLPSFAEGLPVVIMEALALRRPVLTTYIAGIPELVKHQESGWLFPAGDLDKLVDELKSFLNTPIDRLQEMGNAGHQAVIEHHDSDVEAAKLARLFNAHTN